MTPVDESFARALSGRYEQFREIGRGGMATVYRADDVRHGRQVAVKVFEPGVATVLGPERFLREIQIAAQLSHPHIVTLHDSGNVEGRLFYVMPLIEGESLRHRLEAQGKLRIEEALGIVRQVAAALEYAHQRGVIHRDIKPENVLLFEGEAMLADFGIARALTGDTGEHATGTGIVLGTPAYMSPEQAFGEAADARSDQYSLACLLYEMLAGELPFHASSAHSMLAKRLSGPVPSVQTLRAGVPAAIDRALSRALSREADDRFETVSQFVAALIAPIESGLPSIAVLPFRTVGTDPENEYFADGITEDVIANLSKIRALKVISRTSVMQFKSRTQSMQQIGASLGATALLDGSVRRAGDRVRIVAQLIDSSTDQHVWADTYDRELTDIFAIQSEVSIQIAKALEAELSVDEKRRVQNEPTKDVHAYQLYLQARRWMAVFTHPTLKRAIECLDRAVARDPDFALARANIAIAYVELAEQGMMPPAVAYEKARDAAAAALRIDPQLSMAHLTDGYLKMVYDFDWTGAEEAFRRALELSPSNADAYDLYGRLCSSLERYDEAIGLLQRAQELDPLAHRLDLATTLLRAGRYDEAVRRAEEAVAIQVGHDRAQATLGWAYMLTNREQEGIAHLERASLESPDSTLWYAQLGQAYAMTGDPRGREILAKLEERAKTGYVSPYHLAYVYTGLGEFDKAMDWLELAVRERTGATYGIKGSFLFIPLRTHPRFRALLEQMKLGS
jgi:serine/threonine protein kinase/Flp pilus assembly protein TadD